MGKYFIVGRGTRLPIKTMAVLMSSYDISSIVANNSVSITTPVGGVLDDSDTNLQSINFEYEASLGGTAMEKIVIQLRGEHDYTNQYIRVDYGYYVKPKDPTLDILGNMFSNNTNSNCPAIYSGWYKITRSQFDKENEITTLTGYDLMIELMIPYTPNLDPRVAPFPKTIEDFWIDAFRYNHMVLPVPVISSGYNFNPPIMLEVDPYLNISDVTYRDILDDICSLYGRIAVMRNNNYIFKYNKRGFNAINSGSFFILPTQIDTLTYKDLKKLKLHDSFGPVNTIVLGREPQNDNLIYSDVV